MLQLYRAKIFEFIPGWISTGNAEKVMYTLGLHMDVALHQVTEALQHRFPGKLSNESLPYLGYERKMVRGREETDETYATRMKGWRQKHLNRGGPYALLQQVFEHYAPNNFTVELIYCNGKRYTMDTSGSVTVDTVDAGDGWTPDTPERWARWWMFFHWPNVVPPAHEWDEPGLAWDSGWVWNSGLSIQEVADLREIPTGWNAAHCVGNSRIVLLDPGDAWSDVTWGTWGNQIGV